MTVETLLFFKNKPNERKTIEQISKRFLIAIYNARSRQEGNYQKIFKYISTLFRLSHHSFSYLDTEWMRMISDQKYFHAVFLNKLKSDENYSALMTAFIKALRIQYQRLGNKFRIDIDKII